MIGSHRLDFLLATWDAFRIVNPPADVELAPSLTDHLRTGGSWVGVTEGQT
jgi:hypothetical protein